MNLSGGHVVRLLRSLADQQQGHEQQQHHEQAHEDAAQEEEDQAPQAHHGEENGDE